MAKKQTITKAQLTEILLKLKGTTFAFIVTFTDEYGSRVANKQRMLQKMSYRNITIGSDYTARVNRRLEKQGEENDFVSQEMSGKTFVEGSRVVAFMNKNPEKKYLVCDQEKNAKTVVHYFHNGKKISEMEAIAQNMFAPSHFADKKTAGRGEVDIENNFFRLTFGIDNIIAIKLNKCEYIIED